MKKIERRLELEFTILDFYDDYVLSRPRAGELLGAQQVADLVEVCSDHYGDRDFVYLSYRINEYTVNPTIYLNLEEIRNLAGIGVIITENSSLASANFEKNFSKVPYEIFMELEDALEWVQKILKEKKAGL